MALIQCPECGKMISDKATDCPQCGAPISAKNQEQSSQQREGQQPRYQQFSSNQQHNDDAFTAGPSGKTRGVAALLAFFLGTLGIHYFYLGKSTAGIVFLIASLISCGTLATVTAILSIISGIKMLTMNTESFEQQYVYTENKFPI